MKKIQILIGSNAVNSLHRKLANAILKEFSNIADFELLSINDIPFYNYEEEKNMPESVKIFLNKIKEADGVVIMTPEYNNSIPGVLKNALDWASRGDLVFQNKAVLIMGITPSILGTVRAQDHLRLILSHKVYNAKVLNGDQILIGRSFEKFKDEKIVDEFTKKLIETKLKEFVEFM